MIDFYYPPFIEKTKANRTFTKWLIKKNVWIWMAWEHTTKTKKKTNRLRKKSSSNFITIVKRSHSKVEVIFLLINSFSNELNWKCLQDYS